MTFPPLALPVLLRYLRVKNGLSQAGLAERLRTITGTSTITRHDISRYERGKRTPEAWLPALAVALAIDLPVLESAVAVPRLRLADPAHHAAALAERRHVDASLADDLAGLLAANRRLEDQVGSAVLIRTVTRQADLAGRLASESRGPGRPVMVQAAAGWEQFTGWLHASTGDHANATARYRAALELAEEAGDHDMIFTAMAMRGHVAWMAGNIGAMIGLTQAARRDPSYLSPVVLALNAQQEARGHAIEGDYYQMEAGLDQAAELIRGASSSPDAQYFYSPAFLEISAAWPTGWPPTEQPNAASRSHPACSSWPSTPSKAECENSTRTRWPANGQPGTSPNSREPTPAHNTPHQPPSTHAAL